MTMAMAGLDEMHKGIINNGLNKGVNDNCKPWVSWMVERICPGWYSKNSRLAIQQRMNLVSR